MARHSPAIDQRLQCSCESRHGSSKSGGSEDVVGESAHVEGSEEVHCWAAATARRFSRSSNDIEMRRVIVLFE